MKSVKVLICDVDGTLTDNSLYYGANGEELKRFSAKDGMGMVLLQKHGVDIWIISGKTSAPVHARMRDLGIKEVHTGIEDKVALLKILCEKHSIDLANVAYIGDDVNDLACMEMVEITAAPNDAEESIKKIVDFLMKRNAGYGAVRDFCDLIIHHKTN